MKRTNITLIISLYPLTIIISDTLTLQKHDCGILCLSTDATLCVAPKFREDSLGKRDLGRELGSRCQLVRTMAPLASGH